MTLTILIKSRHWHWTFYFLKRFHISYYYYIHLLILSSFFLTTIYFIIIFLNTISLPKILSKFSYSPFKSYTRTQKVAPSQVKKLRPTIILYSPKFCFFFFFFFGISFLCSSAVHEIWSKENKVNQIKINIKKL